MAGSSMVELSAVGSDKVYMVFLWKDVVSAKLQDPRLTEWLQVQVLREEPIYGRRLKSSSEKSVTSKGHNDEYIRPPFQ